MRLSYGKEFMVVAELVDGCKIDCALCWNKSRRPSMHNMTLETVELVLKKYGRKYPIDWFNWGDPLLHKDIITIAQMSKNYRTKISSSFSMHLTPSHFDALNNFKTIIVSLSGMNKQTYNIYHKNGNFKLVIKNLMALCENKNTRIVLRWLSHKYNQGQLELMKDFCSKHNIEYEIVGLNCEVENLLTNFDHPLIKKEKFKTKKKSCKIFNWPTIATDGFYLLYCATHNIKTGPHIKDNITTEQLIETKNKIPICQACQQFKFWKMFC